MVVDILDKPGNFAARTLNPHSAVSTDYFSKRADPAPPSLQNWLGTEGDGRDMVARLLYGFRVSIWFAIALTVSGTALGILMGALQGYFGGRVDLAGQRLIEIWGAIPELYLLIIFASIFEPSLLLLLVLLSLWGWIGLSDYVRAEFLRNRSLDFVKAARAMGLKNRQIIWRHVLPNSMTPVITFLPFRMSAAILSLTALDFLGLGVPPTVPSLGELLQAGQGQPRQLVDHRPDFRAADADDAAADLHRRRAARRVRHPQVMTIAPNAAPLLEIDRLSVRFGDATVVDQVSFSVAAGEKFALVGESGSGKTVTALSILRLSAGAETSGSIRFDGEELLQQVRARDARHPRLGDRHDLPGADDGAEPAVHRRQPDRARCWSCTRRCGRTLRARARSSCWPRPASPTRSAASTPFRTSCPAASASAR